MEIGTIFVKEDNENISERYDYKIRKLSHVE